MIFKSARLIERARGQEKIDELIKHRSKILVIHYSCESFINVIGRSPRITCIAVRIYDTNETKIFSLHVTGQIKQKDFNNISEAEFDHVEKDMLSDFFKFVKKYNTHKWVHWNMRNSSYGFEAIANRYRILGGHPSEIESQFKFDLPFILGNLYTFKYEKDEKPKKGKLLNLAIRNNISTREALQGADEADAFDNKDFLKLQMSTIRKVEMIDRILDHVILNKLKVKPWFITIYGITFFGIIEIVRNNYWLMALSTIILVVLGSAFEPLIQEIIDVKTWYQELKCYLEK